MLKWFALGVVLALLLLILAAAPSIMKSADLAASFTWSADGNVVRFDSTVTGGEVGMVTYGYLWTIQDRGSSNPDFTYTFAARGDYLVILRVTDAAQHVVWTSAWVNIGSIASPDGIIDASGTSVPGKEG